MNIIVRGGIEQIFILLILQISSISKVIGQNSVEPIVVTSLVHEFYLPKNALINPFYDPEIDALRNHDQQIIQASRTRRSTGVADTEATDLTERSAIDSAWENLIVSGPTAVNLLAQVMVLSSKLDFSFREATPDYIFQYVKYPDSFRMTLAQISNEGWRAFLTAHINMDKLQLNMQRIPNHIKIVLKVLTEVQSPIRLQIQMSKTLNTIGRIGNDCIALANDTHMAFSNVMNHLGEVISLTEVSKGLRETRLRETEIELNVSRVWQTELKELNDILKEHYEDTEEDLRFAHVEYSRALARRTSGFMKGLMRIASAVLKLTNNAAKAFGRFTSGNNGSGSTSTALDLLANGRIKPSTENGKALLMAKSLAESMQDLMNIFSDIFYSTNNQTASRNPQEMENILYEMDTYAKLIGDGEVATNIIKSIAERARNLGTKAVQLAKENSFGRQVNRTETDYVLSEFNQLMRDTKKIDAAAGLIDDSSRTKSRNGGSYSSDSEKMLVQITQQKLQEARKRSEASLAQLRKNMDEMSELVGKIALLDLTRLNYAELLDYMRQALRLLGTMRETWAQLVLFFSTIASQAEIALTGTLSPFIKQTTLATTNAISIEERNFFIDLLKDQSVSIHDTSYSLFLMSRTYVDMSNEFLMPRLSGLSLMLTAKNDNERMILNNKLASETITTQAKVKTLVEERKKTYTTMIDNQRTKLQTYLQSLGGPSTDNQQAIEEASQLLARQ